MSDSPYVATTNACKLCTPLGAALAFKGVQGCVPFLHGSQGCATYMRRYVISHFREPVDIASSALGEKQAVFGGGPNLKKGLINVMRKYAPAVVGVATTCLTETIGDDVGHILHEFGKEFGDLDLPVTVYAHTPSYSGTHMEGFHAAVLAMAEQLGEPATPAHGRVNIFPGLVSTADLRHLRSLVRDFGLEPTLLPDYADTLDGPAREDYEPIPAGGTPLDDIRAMPGARASIEMGRSLDGRTTAGIHLEKTFGVANHAIGLPIGLRESDRFLDTLARISGRPVPEHLEMERGRLVDAMVDGHKYVAGKRVVVYGEQDLVAGLTSFLAETGAHPVLVATGETSSAFKDVIGDLTRGLIPKAPLVRQGVDFHDVAQTAADLAPDLLLGHSKGFGYAREFNIPLVRVGFPVHDRFGGPRILHLGHAGALNLFDRLVNACLEHKQSASPVGYGYM